jgi:hypothetical protein
VELRNLVKGKIDALNPEAKEFVNGVSLRLVCQELYSNCLQVIEKMKSLRPKSGEKPNLEELRKQANEIVEK